MNGIFKSTATAALVLTAAMAAVALCLAQWNWAGGVAVGALWLTANLFFLVQLLEMGFTPHIKRQNDKILLVSILKFPVLYVAGFFILRSQVFPVSALLAGLTAVVTALGLSWMRLNLAAGKAEKSA